MKYFILLLAFALTIPAMSQEIQWNKPKIQEVDLRLEMIRYSESQTMSDVFKFAGAALLSAGLVLSVAEVSDPIYIKSRRSTVQTLGIGGGICMLTGFTISLGGSIDLRKKLR